MSIAVIAIASVAAISPGHAEFRVCNKSGERLDVALGYDGGRQGWISEGWWNIGVNRCVAVRNGDLDSRYYYLYAQGSSGTEWSADDDDEHGALFCVSDKEFVLNQRRYDPSDEEACKKNGLQSKRFFMVDVGDYTRWTQTLEPDTPQTPARPNPSPSNQPPPSSGGGGSVGGNACQRYPNLC